MRAFALVYGQPVPEAFIAAGYMEADDVSGPATSRGRMPGDEDTAVRIWKLNGLPEEARRRLILELLQRPSESPTQSS